MLTDVLGSVGFDAALSLSLLEGAFVLCALGVPLRRALFLPPGVFTCRLLLAAGGAAGAAGGAADAPGTAAFCSPGVEPIKLKAGCRGDCC